MGMRRGPVTSFAGIVAVAIALVTLWLVRPLFSPAPSRDVVGAPHGSVRPSGTRFADPGVSINDPRAFPGYTLLAPMQSTTTFLVDNQGRVVRTWESDCTPALGASLLENGHLLRPGALKGVPGDDGPGAGGRVQEFTWQGDLVWDFQYHDDYHLPHHDITRLPNGNVLMIVWEKKRRADAVAAGRRPELVPPALLLDCLIEVKPTGRTTGEVVWEWHLWDHLIQDHDTSKPNYGAVGEHPELVDFNFSMDTFGAIMRSPNGMDRLRSIGYVGGGSPGSSSGVHPTWSHFNAVAYNPELDQVVVSVHGFSELWVIDHSTTKAEAAGHRGGRSGKGGDLLYRWGNPRAYRAGTQAEQRLFAPHDAHWIPRGLPGAGHVLVFNNGVARPDGNYSSVEELVLPVDGGGRYTRPSGAAYGPDQPSWRHPAQRNLNFYSFLLSGAQRLPNGNTLICAGVTGTLLEATPNNEVVWRYVNPTPAGTVPSDVPASQFKVAQSLFRVYRYGPEYAGLSGKDLTPAKTIEAMVEQLDATPTRTP